MKPKKIYGPWTKWHGGECPVPLDTMVEVKYRNGALGSWPRAGGYFWRHGMGEPDIAEYRTFTEVPDLEAAEKLLRANGYKITPPTRPLTFDDVVPITETLPEGTEYWVVSVWTPEGVYRTQFYDRGVDHRAIQRRMAYLDKEHALIAAQHIFGLKGGEL